MHDAAKRPPLRGGGPPARRDPRAANASCGRSANRRGRHPTGCGPDARPARRSDGQGSGRRCRNVTVSLVCPGRSIAARGRGRVDRPRRGGRRGSDRRAALALLRTPPEHGHPVPPSALPGRGGARRGRRAVVRGARPGSAPPPPRRHDRHPASSPTGRNDRCGATSPGSDRAGSRTVTPWVLAALTVLSCGAAVAAVGGLLRRRRVSPWWALLVLVFGAETLTEFTPELLAPALLVVGIVWWQRGRVAPAVGALVRRGADPRDDAGGRGGARRVDAGRAAPHSRAETARRGAPDGAVRRVRGLGRARRPLAPAGHRSVAPRARLGAPGGRAPVGVAARADRRRDPRPGGLGHSAICVVAVALRVP